MNAMIYCFDKGLFVKKKFIKALKEEFVREFGTMDRDMFVRSEELLCKINNPNDSYFMVYDKSDDFDRLIEVLIRVSKKYHLILACSLRWQEETCLVDHIRGKVIGENIKVRAAMTI